MPLMWVLIGVINVLQPGRGGSYVIGFLSALKLYRGFI